MGYACPVCEDPQADAGHLANHLAFTALTGGGDHEDWLDEHVPEWEQLGEEGVADEIAGEAEETEFPQVFEESGLEDSHGHGHGEESLGHGVDPSAARSRGAGDLDDEARSIMEDARELTEEMRREGDRETDDGSENGADDADDESGAETE